MRVEPANVLYRALGACGLDPASVDETWDDLCQQSVLTFPGPDAAFSEETLAQLADLSLRFPSRFTFAASATQDRFTAAVYRSPAMVRSREDGARDRLALLETRGLAWVEPFHPADETLAAFAQRIEAAGGIGRRLDVSGDALVIAPQDEPITFDKFRTLLSLLEHTAPSVRLVLVNEEAAGGET